MITNAQTVIKSLLNNHHGDKIFRKIVIIESDDWGAIRLPQKPLYGKYRDAFGPSLKSSYLNYDTIAGPDDLTNLFNVLNNHKDCAGNPACITFNTIMANPDFQKIKESEFTTYHKEPFTKTIERYSGSRTIDLWKKAIDERLMFPQFHGREHVNVPEWLQMLRTGDKAVTRAFDFETWTFPPNLTSLPIRLQASLDYYSKRPDDYINSFLKEGLELFSKIFGYKSKTFIPPNFVVDQRALHTCLSLGVRSFQGMKYQILPYGHDFGSKKLIRRVMQKDKPIINFIRNCVFEPSLNGNGLEEVEKCLLQIRSSFYSGKPAIITAHRLNFIGGIHLKNREENLTHLDLLLKRIIQNWPDVLFMDSASFSDFFINDKIRK